jgi:hypothetical protein
MGDTEAQNPPVTKAKVYVKNLGKFGIEVTGPKEDDPRKNPGTTQTPAQKPAQKPAQTPAQKPARQQA